MSDICSKCGFDMDAQFEARARLIDKLEAYEKGCANLESEIAHLRQENAELRAELLALREMFPTARPRPTQDPSTATAYGLYPSSARPVNPQSK